MPSSTFVSLRKSGRPPRFRHSIRPAGCLTRHWHVPKAIGYALNNHRALTRFTTDPRLPPDNNRSEAALRIVALGRKNYLFVGNEDAGINIAGLYSLVATCAAHGKNPLEYLTDVLIRISSHPQSRIDELLPDRWQPAAI